MSVQTALRQSWSIEGKPITVSQSFYPVVPHHKKDMKDHSYEPLKSATDVKPIGAASDKQ